MVQVLPEYQIQDKIYLIRGVQVMMDKDLAELYEVETGALKRAVKRNIERFPLDFMFELTKAERETLRYQFGTSNMENDDNLLKTKENFGRQFGTSKVENLVENFKPRGGDRFALLFSLNPGLRCFQVCCAVKRRYKSILLS